ncbi:MAG: SRPBCC family protein [Chryseolinea sp.]
MSGNGEMYPGQIIRYKIYILPGIPMIWTTEITHVHEPHFFVDEQRSGPYAFWHHQHRFRETASGVEMTDELNYAIPFGLIGRTANTLLVQRQLNAIFDYRYKVLSEYFPDHNAPPGNKPG